MRCSTGGANAARPASSRPARRPSGSPTQPNARKAAAALRVLPFSLPWAPRAGGRVAPVAGDAASLAAGIGSMAHRLEFLAAAPKNGSNALARMTRIRWRERMTRIRWRQKMTRIRRSAPTNDSDSLAAVAALVPAPGPIPSLRQGPVRSSVLFQSRFRRRSLFAGFHPASRMEGGFRLPLALCRSAESELTIGCFGRLAPRAARRLGQPCRLRALMVSLMLAP